MQWDISTGCVTGGSQRRGEGEQYANELGEVAGLSRDALADILVNSSRSSGKCFGISSLAARQVYNILSSASFATSRRLHDAFSTRPAPTRCRTVLQSKFIAREKV